MRRIQSFSILSFDAVEEFLFILFTRKVKACIIKYINHKLVDSKNHFAEIEYCIGSAFQCKGLATEATKAVIKYGFERMNLHKVQICTKTINKPSQRVIEKCGFIYEGTLRDYFFMDNQYVGRMDYSLLRSEFKNNR